MLANCWQILLIKSYRQKHLSFQIHASKTTKPILHLVGVKTVWQNHVLVQGRSRAFVCKNCQKVHKSHIAKIRKYILTWRNNREKILFCPLGASYFCRYTLFTCHWRRDPQIEFLGRQIVSHFAHFSYDSN